ncbi:MAG: bifunctional folylpolyglutamate synthase/dihydrofolate synthase [Thermoleophilaceae bacterium]
MAWSLQEAEEYLLGLELFGMRFGLERMHRLTTALGMPQRRFAQIHVVGSNGKSSTVRFIAALLERHGLRTGSYTSPHLVSFRERIEVGEKPVTGERFAAAVERTAEAVRTLDRAAAADDSVTQFEALTAAAYHELAAQRVEVAVIEAGLGGRFDATNVIPSRVQVLTGVGLEHTRWLGPTVTDIAGEKLAVVRDHATLVTGALDSEAEAVARRVTGERHARWVRAPESSEAPLLAAGEFQRRNFAVACAATEAFLGRDLDPVAVDAAAAHTRISGRLDQVETDPLTFYDGAHNPAGEEALAPALQGVLGSRAGRVLVASILDDKDAAAMLATLLPVFHQAIFTRCSNPRSLSPGTLESLAVKLGGPPVATVGDPREALGAARAAAGRDGAVVVPGSIYLIADLVRPAGHGRGSTL